MREKPVIETTWKLNEKIVITWSFLIKINFLNQIIVGHDSNFVFVTAAKNKQKNFLLTFISMRVILLTLLTIFSWTWLKGTFESEKVRLFQIKKYFLCLMEMQRYKLVFFGLVCQQWPFSTEFYQNLYLSSQGLILLTKWPWNS